MKSEFIFDQESDLLAFDVKGKRLIASYAETIAKNLRADVFC